MNKTIAEVVDSVRGGATPPRVIDRYWNGTIPWVTVKDLVGDKVSISETVECITEEGVRSCSTNVVPANGLIVCTRIAVGKAVVPTVPMAINQDLKWLVLKPDCDTFYTAYQFQHAQERIHGIAIGSTVRGISLRELRGLSFHFPDPTTQRTIARILGTVDGLIERTEALIAKQQQIKQGLLHDLFTRGVDAHGALRPPHSEAPELYHETALGWLPKGWRVERIASITARVGSGVTPRGGSEVYLSEGVLFIRSQNVTNEGLLLDDVAFINEQVHEDMANSSLESFDVLLNITGASIGRCCYLPDGLGPANTNQHVCCIRPHQANEPTACYVAEYLAGPYGQGQIYRSIAGGNREGLNYQQIRGFQLPWPDADERALIAQRFQTANNSNRREEELLEKYRLLKVSLMQDLLTGRVSVEQLATSEASALNTQPQ